MGRGVAHFLHGQPYAAGLLVQALIAAAIRGLADARNERQWALKDANYLPDRDISRRSRQHVAAATTELALEQTVPRQFEKDCLEEFLRQLLTFGKLGC